MNRLFFRLLVLLLLTPFLGGCLVISSADWTTLFDGTSTDAWRGYRQAGFPAQGWEIRDGTLHQLARGGGGDLVSRQKFDSFELRFEWKVSPGANSGVMYRVSEDGAAPYESGPEYQVLDDAKHPDGHNPKTSASALYALIAPGGRELKPVGQWNKARIVVRGNHVEHWLNKRKVVEYELGSPALTELIAKSKFRDMPHFAKEPAGHICLQDHGDEVWYRNIRIRTSGPKNAKTK